MTIQQQPDTLDATTREQARRARSIVVTGSHVEIGILNQRSVVPRHLVDVRGSVVMKAEFGAGPCLARVLNGEPSPLLELLVVDVAAVPQAERTRGVVWMAGRLERIEIRNCAGALDHLQAGPDEPLVRFCPELIELNCRLGAARDQREVLVPLDAYRRARHDPLTGWEGTWLAELHREDPELMRLLAATRLELGGQDRVRAVAADSGGIILRVYTDDGVQDLRLAFERPAGCPCRAREAFDALIDRLL